MKLLALDTATEGCSAALLIDGELRTRFEILGRGHAERLLPMVDELLGESGLALGRLDAIAFGRGPGAFTGVRIAVSIAQGLALGSGLPVVPVSDLAALALQALERAAREWAARARVARERPASTAPGTALACLDARMKEVYWGLGQGRTDGGLDMPKECLGAPGDVAVAGEERLVAAGHGLAAYPELRTRFAPRLIDCWPEMLPRAEEVARLAVLELRAGRALRPEQAQPLYLRNDVATRSARPAGR